jgi:hypothetical protein
LTKVGDTQYKFYQPIRIGQPVCLKCHGKGEDMPEAVEKLLMNSILKIKQQVTTLETFEVLLL